VHTPIAIVERGTVFGGGPLLEPLDPSGRLFQTSVPQAGAQARSKLALFSSLYWSATECCEYKTRHGHTHVLVVVLRVDELHKRVVDHQILHSENSAIEER
jgi:hypothetical protein